MRMTDGFGEMNGLTCTYIHVAHDQPNPGTEQADIKTTTFNTSHLGSVFIYIYSMSDWACDACGTVLYIISHSTTCNMYLYLVVYYF